MNSNQNLYLGTSIVIVVACLILGIYFMVPKADEAIKAYGNVKTKTLAVEGQKTQVEQLKAQQVAYEKEVKVSTKPVYKNDTMASDPMSSFGVMFEDVIQSAKYNGLKLRSISYNTSPGADVVQKNISSEYNVCAISMQLIGNYMQFRSYFQDIYNYPYLINLDKIIIKPYANNKRILIADITVTLYSEKSEAQKQSAAAAAAQSQADVSQPGGQTIPGGMPEAGGQPAPGGMPGQPAAPAPGM